MALTEAPTLRELLDRTNMLKAEMRRLTDVFDVEAKVSLARMNRVSLETYFHMPFQEWIDLKKSSNDFEMAMKICLECGALREDQDPMTCPLYLKLCGYKHARQRLPESFVNIRKMAYPGCGGSALSRVTFCPYCLAQTAEQGTVGRRKYVLCSIHNRKYRYPDIIRASGDVVCEMCFFHLRDHPYDMKALDKANEMPFLHIACDGVRLKL